MPIFPGPAGENGPSTNVDECELSFLKCAHLIRVVESLSQKANIIGRDGAILLSNGVRKTQASTIVLNPPYIIRFTSKGIGADFIILTRRGSFITFALTRSRWTRDLNTM